MPTLSVSSEDRFMITSSSLTRALRATPILALAILAVTACDQGTISDPEDEEARLVESVAVVAADAAIEDLGAMADVTFLPDEGPAQVHGGTGMGARSDLVRERTVTFLDGDGQEQSAYDPLTTASIHAVLVLEGQVQRQDFQATLERRRELWVTGLEGSESRRTFNGTGTESHSSTGVRDDDGLRTFEMTATSSIDDVVRGADLSTEPWPLSGTITRQVSVVVGRGVNDAVTREHTVTVTFNGTRYVTLNIDGEVFELDLEIGASDRPLSRRGGA
jgi:hypothetical protein